MERGSLNAGWVESAASAFLAAAKSSDPRADTNTSVLPCSQRISIAAHRVGMSCFREWMLINWFQC